MRKDFKLEISLFEAQEYPKSPLATCVLIVKVGGFTEIQYILGYCRNRIWYNESLDCPIEGHIYKWYYLPKFDDEFIRG